jgi:iron complex transport system ATP-binding protein
MKQHPVIETSALSIGYARKGKQPAVVHRSLDLQLFPGELTGLLGLNGVGKSTLLRTLCGFQPALGGEIRIMNKPLASYSQSELSRTIGVVLTEKTNAGGITVYDLVALGRHPYTGFFGQLKKEDHAVVEASLEATGIAHKANRFVSELSDGERQKAMIAKALAQQCPVIILDEPNAFLDVISRIEMMALLHRLAAEQGKAILLSAHDLDLALQMSDCIWLQTKERPMVCGAPEDLALDGELERFLNTENIVFDRSNGKLNALAPSVPVGVEGEADSVYWIGNALIRNGYSPSPVNKAYPCIHCKEKRQMILTLTDGRQLETNRVEALIKRLKDYKIEGCQTK